MNPLPTLLCAILLSGCTSTFTDASKLETSIAHKIDGDKILVTARIVNRSDRPLTFVRHPHFYNMSVRATDRSKDEAFNLMAVCFVRAKEESLVVVRPGEAATFSESFCFKRRSAGVVDVSQAGLGWVSANSSYWRIRDKELQATFHYVSYPDNLPLRARTMGRNYVIAEIAARETFPAP